MKNNKKSCIILIFDLLKYILFNLILLLIKDTINLCKPLNYIK